jgi:hypothetical protein
VAARDACAPNGKKNTVKEAELPANENSLAVKNLRYVCPTPVFSALTPLTDGVDSGGESFLPQPVKTAERENHRRNQRNPVPPPSGLTL